MNNELSAQPYTFLRIKRKRNEEPLDALGNICACFTCAPQYLISESLLVVESGARRKKPKGRNGVFQFAKTIEEGVWEDEEQKKAIQACSAQHQLSILAHQPTTQEDSAPPPDNAAATSSTLKPAQATDIRRYTIIERSLPIDHLPLRKPTSPPQILSSKELATQRANSDFKMYDAVLENPPAEEQIDPALEKLLQDYLKLETSSVPTPTASKAADYVWDIFYHRPRTYTQSLTDAVAVGTVYDTHEKEVKQSGLPPLASGDSDSDSYSEEEDEADEDSNAEEWYTNDYPEEEESDWSHDDDDGSDEFHENTVDGDVEHEWR
ncbi:hypothetical protein F5050DRAFT_1709433 [Lentinula boryana]|uniref:Probable RNA polymerase II nuclear localization protein SLC7A6OS n=1 Tax=Lentinula boryana TaxID=40481 RepID=A0ABQ8QMS3_9AGAR|nr:hypothetical protein F5050DRAFT_1709433 [Lentinula boryana]